MHDEIDGRLWAEHGSAFSEMVAKFINQLRLAAKARVAFEFDAPWRRERQLRTNS